MQDIDFVVPYVNGNDPLWINEFNKFSFKPKYGDGNKLVRYGGDETLKYVFRSIEAYAPWIRKVHLLVMQDSQVPSWVNREKVHIVYHKDFIPEEHLPVFNSSAIEMYLWNIPDCSEHFLYGNDDCFFNAIVNSDDYFSGEKVKDNLRWTKYVNSNILNAAYLTTFMNAAKLGMYGTKFEPIQFSKMLLPTHHIKPLKLSVIKQIYTLHKEKIEASISKFREEYNLNQYLFTYYMFSHDMCESSSRKCIYIKNIESKRNALTKALYNNSVVETCINDINTTTQEDKIFMVNLLEEKFPNKSKFEI